MAWSDRSGWLSVAGVEVVNSNRLAGYARSGGCTGTPAPLCVMCAPLAEDVSDPPPPFASAATDSAPWYDPSWPPSARFWGVGGVDFLGVAAQSRETFDGRPIREVQMRLIMGAADQSGLSYGIGWLAAALGGAPCTGSGCGGGEACLAVYCPTGPNATDPVRHLIDVTVVEPPVAVRQWEQFGGVWQEVEVTLRSESWYLFGEPTAGAQVSLFPAAGQSQEIDLLTAYEDCPEVEECGTDPDCPPVALPQIPTPPLDACYPAEPFAGTVARAPISSLQVPEWIDAVPVIEIVTGDTALRNLTVRFYANPLDLECQALLETSPCTACADVTITYLPPESTTVVDGRTLRASTECLSAGGPSVTAPPIYGAQGSQFEWPTISCGYGVCVEVSAASGASPEAEVNVGLHTRWEAA